jgi:MYXO-CTERM domain-containing protein
LLNERAKRRKSPRVLRGESRATDTDVAGGVAESSLEEVAMLVRSCLPLMRAAHRPLAVGTCALALTAACWTVGARDARACGGCMHPPPGPTEVDITIVTDHRMVFSISPAQTVLWDQIRYSGNPSDFAWVLPIKPGARIELSQDAWMAALDASTQTVIQGPSASCYSAPPREYDGSGGGGCMGSSNASSADFAAGAGEDGGATGPSPVQVISQQVVGPYDAVTVRSSQGEALGEWLRANGYDVPTSIQPTIDAFSNSGFDFIALRLAPGEGVQAMQPVRVITPGADPYLPLRMVAAGVGANVGLELFVLSEGRYHTQNFPDATIDFSKLAWDPSQQRSNYTVLAAAALAANGGTGFLTESSGPADLYGTGGFNPPLATTYETTCRPLTLPPPPGCGTDKPEAGTDAAEVDAGGVVDAGDEGGPELSEAGSGTGPDAAPGPEAGSGACEPVTIPCDDLSLAMTGIAADLWVTRLRASLPAAALSADLILEATTPQAVVSNVHTTSVYTDPNYNPCPNSASASNSNSHSGCACETQDAPHAHYADAILAALGLVAVAGIARRRRTAHA